MSTNVDDLIAQLNGLGPDDLSNDARLRLVEASRGIMARLETPNEQAFRLGWVNPCVFAVLKTTIDLGIWASWRQTGEREKTLGELLEMCQVRCDLNLLRRLMRLLTADHLVVEVAEDRYRSSEFSWSLGDSKGAVAQTVLGGTHHVIDSTRNLPGFLAKLGYEEPVDPFNTCYMDATPEKLSIWDRCKKNPDYQASFTGFMKALTEIKAPWTDIYDTQQLLEGYKGDHGDGVLVVDVGGGHGNDMMSFLEKHPSVSAGQLVLQDRREVISIARVDAKIATMPHDFFTEQPVIGARAYFFHVVLHDWDDLDARRILKRIAAAMTRGYSKLLLCEHLLPPQGATILNAMTDVGVMHLLSAGERTEVRWRTLLESTDFKLVKIWQSPSSVESIIEAEVF